MAAKASVGACSESANGTARRRPSCGDRRAERSEALVWPQPAVDARRADSRRVQQEWRANAACGSEAAPACTLFEDAAERQLPAG